MISFSVKASSSNKSSKIIVNVENSILGSNKASNKAAPNSGSSEDSEKRISYSNRNSEGRSLSKEIQIGDLNKILQRKQPVMVKRY